MNIAFYQVLQYYQYYCVHVCVKNVLSTVYGVQCTHMIFEYYNKVWQ